MRYLYGFYKTRDKAEDALEESYAMGDVSPGERPQIERQTDHRGRVEGYRLTLMGASAASPPEAYCRIG